LFRDENGRVVYVGKAKTLRHRVPNYFGLDLHPRTSTMVAAAASVEWIVTSSEVEALQLEVTLIKQHQPRYNVRYRDDKSYPYLAISLSEAVPRALVTRGRKKKGNVYYGPYTHAYAIRETLDLLLKVFPIRSCSQGVYDRAHRSNRPCLLFHIGRCCGPCIGAVNSDEHMEIVRSFCRFMEGDHEPVLRELRDAMEQSSRELRFEQAARARDRLAAVRRVIERQEMVSEKREDLDAIAYFGDELEASFQVFFVRAGRVVGRKGFIVDRVEDLAEADLLASFIETLYADSDRPPRRILTPLIPASPEVLELWLSMRRGSPVNIRTPMRGPRKALVETIAANAREAFAQNRLRRAGDFAARAQALRQLQEILDLPEAPLRIECFDISNLGPTEVVGAMVVFEDALPKKSDYRKFKVRTVAGQDDFAAMGEVIGRRFAQLKKAESENPKDPQTRPQAFAYPPGLVVIDGGKGQLNRAVDTMSDLGIVGIPVISLAKRLEEVFVPGESEPRIIPRGADALYLLQRVRDETHRFAVTYQRARRTAALTDSVLDDLDGIGPTRRKALLRHFGSVKGLSNAGIKEIAGVAGIGPHLAELIYRSLKN